MSESLLLTRPHLQLAALCEKHLVDKDNVVSLIRIIDRFIIAGTDESLPPTVLIFTLAVMFKAGNFRGRAEVGVEPLSPSMAKMGEMKMSVNFDAGDDQGVNILSQVKLEVTEEGLHWLIVSFAGEEYTRIPLRVVYQKQPSIQTG